MSLKCRAAPREAGMPPAILHTGTASPASSSSSSLVYAFVLVSMVPDLHGSPSSQLSWRDTHGVTHLWRTCWMNVSTDRYVARYREIQYVCLSVRLSVSRPVYLFECLHDIERYSMSVCPSVRLSVSRPVYLFECLHDIERYSMSVWPSVCLSLGLSIYLSVCMI